jgi:hypothetical protein
VNVDLNCQPEHGVPMWNETRWAGCYNPEQNVGLFLHAGRLRGNLDWWWVQTAIYLPDGQIAVDRSWVRDTIDTGVITANLNLVVLEQGWRADFDGIVELTSTTALGAAPRGSGSPSVPATFHVIGDASGPWWDMLEGLPAGQDFAQMHVEQIGRSQGSVTVGSNTYSLDGISYYDHSSGVRDWTLFHSHHFAMIEMPGYRLHVGQVHNSPTESRKGGGVWFADDGEQLRVTRSEVPRLTDVSGAPAHFDWLIKVQGKGELTYKVEVCHTFPSTITFENDNINGCDWGAEGDPLFPIECQVKVTAPDGAVGYGHFERSNRRSALLEVGPISSAQRQRG